MPSTRLDHYRVSQRVTLRPGMRFRANQGPLFRLADGRTVSIAAQGPFTFRAYWVQDGWEWIEALDREQRFAPLHVSGTRPRITQEIIARPYRIRSTLRPKKKGR
jgi:hypothetical protein